MFRNLEGHVLNIVKCKHYYVRNYLHKLFIVNDTFAPNCLFSDSHILRRHSTETRDTIV